MERTNMTAIRWPQGRPQANAQDARASTKLMDLEATALLN